MTLTLAPGELTRAKKRMVRRREDGDWFVEGDARLGDAYPSYRVSLNGQRYHCSCYEHKNGHTRSARMCSHVKAVVLWRAKRRVLDKARERVAAKNNRISAVGGTLSLGRNLPAAELSGDGAGSTPSPRDPRFGSTPLPLWVESFRGDQWVAIEEAMDAYRRGAKVVFLDAPTGAGKSLIGEVTRRLALVSRIGLYVATTKHLQDQLARDFPYASLLMGRANYTPIAGKGKWVTCADCTKTQDAGCQWCPDVYACPYEVAKVNALNSDLAVLNTSYFLTEANGPGRFSKRGQNGLVICDEADLLERELMSHVEVRLTSRRQKELGVSPPSKKTVEDSWQEWVHGEALPKVEQAVAAWGSLSSLHDPRDIRAALSVRRLRTALRRLGDELGAGGWVYDYQSRDDSEIAFKPVRVDRYGRDNLWGHGAKFLLMSATIISAGQMAQDLGLEGDWEVVKVPMSFPVENRPVRIVPVVEMTNKTKDDAWPVMADAVLGVLKLHPDERVLVHTVSYGLANHISSHLRKNTRRTIVTYTEGSGKKKALDKYLGTKAAVMVAPSMDRGVDLPGDACRVQVIAKIPYPNLGDKQVNARMHSTGGRSWYAVETVRTVVQMCGRGVRSKDDHAVTYILDHTWTTNLWGKNRQLFPQWFRDALDWRFPKHLVCPPVDKGR